ncbi:hypothetical protein tloyanaT_26600 [Thalassotalea loyana]|uniref:Thiamin/hydroxymethyl pyrimidine-binding YkoF putative domain-containing protein n=1 Tax=Thalassotalea loyana TaxID=280483 RepID=A0ABQ6HFQ0_9GAMM|nr:hypothetical protein [Thalassotalea loyana]GLX86407.1 hypothetical protein tloyanaT_26600 [Thalassotalea loyana]
MQVSFDISLYPLAEAEYKDEIWAFIERLNRLDGLKVITNGMSTQVFGEYDYTTEHVMKEIRTVHQNVGSAVFILKMIASDRSHLINHQGNKPKK